MSPNPPWIPRLTVLERCSYAPASAAQRRAAIAAKVVSRPPRTVEDVRGRAPRRIPSDGPGSAPFGRGFRRQSIRAERVPASCRAPRVDEMARTMALLCSPTPVLSLLTASSSRMELPVDSMQVVSIHCRVNLGRPEIAVTQQLLHHPQRGSPVQ